MVRMIGLRCLCTLLPLLTGCDQCTERSQRHAPAIDTTTLKSSRCGLQRQDLLRCTLCCDDDGAGRIACRHTWKDGRVDHE
jgi:hypothetical protein